MDVGDAVPRADFLDLSEIRNPQHTRWAQQAERVQSSSAFYREYLNGRQLANSLDGLVDIPFTDKEMIRKATIAGFLDS